MARIKSVEVKVPAKVNLALKVGGIGLDGFHPIETLFHAVGIYDTIVANASDGLGLEFSGEGAQSLPLNNSNLAWKAAELIAEYAGVEPKVHLSIHKNIPIAGGMAGGSADAAGTLVACDALWQLNLTREELMSLAAQLGSDISFPLVGGTAIGRGRGEEVTSLLTRGEIHWVFAVSAEGLSTPKIYQVFDEMNPNPDSPKVPTDLISALTSGDIKGAAKLMVNDLQAPAISQRPVLAKILQAGEHAGALHGIVSGSGPTCAFVARSHNDAMIIANELQVSGVVERTLIGVGPVKAAHVTDLTYF
ncbi:MAG: 4-diphosphocytidyl-2-C-methyl-D-erythritol kinase [Actinomycetota bacterium]